MHKNFRYNTEMIPPSPSFCLFISLSFHFAVPFQIRIASFLLFTGMSSRDRLCCSRPEGCSQPAEEEKEEKEEEEKMEVEEQEKEEKKVEEQEREEEVEERQEYNV